MSFQKKPGKILAQSTGHVFALSESNKLLLIGIAKHQIKNGLCSL